MSKARQLAELGSVYDDGALSNRNLIINGAMQVAQRGTSFSGITDQYTLDRWTSSSAGGVSLNVSQQTATSTDNGYFASKYFARYQRNAVLSSFVHKVEDLQQFNDKTFMLSFWAKSADAGTNVALTTWTLNDGSSFNAYVTKTDVLNPTLSGTWQKYKFRLTFQDMYTYGFSGSHHLRLQIFDSSNAATFDIAEVQLEAGDTATPFEHRSYGQELALCQRYYYQVDSKGTGGSYPAFMAFRYKSTTNTYTGVLNHPTYMRTGPSVSFESGMRVHLPGTIVEAGTFGAFLPDERSVAITINPGTTNDTSVIAAYPDGDVAGNSKKIYVDAEL
jgi:hypothetical protein